MSTLALLDAQTALNILTGGIGFKRVESTDGDVVMGTTSGFTDFNYIVAVKAKNGALTYGPNCVAAVGDAPSNTDTLSQDEIDWVRLTTIDVASGVAWIYCI